jgi:hypothetical protein
MDLLPCTLLARPPADVPRHAGPAPHHRISSGATSLRNETPAMADKGTIRTSPRSAERRPWIAPRVEDLPRLTELTLITAPIEGNCGVGGSTCF